MVQVQSYLVLLYPCRCVRVAPGHILNLRVQPGNAMAQICWDGVDNDACIDEYR